MKFFTAIKQSEFAAALLAAAGFNLEALATAGDTNALKAHLDSLKPSADHAALVTENATLNAALASAKKDNDEFAANLAKAIAAHAEALAASTAATARAALFTTALAAKGVKLEAATAEKPLTQASIETALEARISTKARERVAAHGHNEPLPVEASSDPSKGGKSVIDPKLSPSARLAARLRAQRQGSN